MKKIIIFIMTLMVIFNVSIVFVNAQETHPKFLTYPFSKQNAVIVASWYYSSNNPHRGIDYDLNYEDVLAAADGTVETVLDNQPNTYPNNYNWGNYVRIDHGNGFKTIYAHLKTGEIGVQVGENITRGQIIATSGNTGYSSGPHLHFEVWGPNTGGELSSGAYKYDPYGIYSTSGDITAYTNNQMNDNLRLWTTNPPSHALYNPPTQFDLTQGSEGFNPGYDTEFTSTAPLTVNVTGVNPGIESPELLGIDLAHYSTIKIRAKVEGSNTSSSGKVYFKDHLGDWSNYFDIGTGVDDGNGYKIWTADISDVYHVNSDPEIEQFSIELTDNGTSGDTWTFDYVKFYANGLVDWVFTGEPMGWRGRFAEFSNSNSGSWYTAFDAQTSDISSDWSSILSPIFTGFTGQEDKCIEFRLSVKDRAINYSQLKARFMVDGAWETDNNIISVSHASGDNNINTMEAFYRRIPLSGNIEQIRIDVLTDGSTSSGNDLIQLDYVKFTDIVGVGGALVPTHQVTINSIPQGAEIWNGNDYWDTAPEIRYLPENYTYYMTAKMTGYDDMDFQFTVGTSNMIVDVDMMTGSGGNPGPGDPIVSVLGPSPNPTFAGQNWNVQFELTAQDDPVQNDTIRVYYSELNYVNAVLMQEWTNVNILANDDQFYSTQNFTAPGVGTYQIYVKIKRGDGTEELLTVMSNAVNPRQVYIEEQNPGNGIAKTDAFFPYDSTIYADVTYEFIVRLAEVTGNSSLQIADLRLSVHDTSGTVLYDIGSWYNIGISPGSLWMQEDEFVFPYSGQFKLGLRYTTDGQTWIYPETFLYQYTNPGPPNPKPLTINDYIISDSLSAVDDFNSSSNGMLIGQNEGYGWNNAWISELVGDKFLVQDNVTLGDSGKAVMIDCNTIVGESKVSRNITPATTGLFTFYMRRSSGERHHQSTILYSNQGELLMHIYLSNAANGSNLSWGYGNGSNGIIDEALVPYAIDTWYKCDIYFDVSVSQYRVRINDGAWTTWENFINDRTPASVSKLSFFKNNQGGVGEPVFYWDMPQDHMSSPDTTSAPADTNCIVGSSLVANLVSYWKLDEESGTRIDVHAGHDLTEYNSVGFRTGVQDNAVNMDKSNYEYLAISDAEQENLDVTGDMSISCWVNFSSITSSGDYQNELVSKWGNGQYSYIFDYYSTPSQDVIRFIRRVYANNDNAEKQAQYVFNTGEWYHVVGTWDALNKDVKIYINGVDMTSAGVINHTSFYNSTHPVCLGVRQGNNSSYIGYLDGGLDDVGIWSRDLSATEVNKLYNNGNSIPYDSSVPLAKQANGGNEEIIEDNNNVPTKFALHQNFPNPFNPTTTISYDIPEDVHVNLEIFNVIGQKIVTLVNRNQDAGYKSVLWNGLDQFSNPMPSGIYIYRLNAGNFIKCQKMVFIK